MSTDTIVKTYFDAWLRNDRERVRGLLHDDLRFRSPEDAYDSADAFLDACWRHAKHMESLEYVQEAFGSSSAYVAYRMGDFVVGEFHRIRDGRIEEICVTFSPTTVR